jgi:hypothetical protein
MHKHAGKEILSSRTLCTKEQESRPKPHRGTRTTQSASSTSTSVLRPPSGLAPFIRFPARATTTARHDSAVPRVPTATMNLSAFRPVFRPFRASIFRTPTASQSAPQCLAPRIPSTTSSFSSTARLEKRSKGGPGKDPRISM